MRPEKPEVLIIGGGIVGCSIAYHLAKRGLCEVLVVEQNTLGSGSSCRAAGGIRQQFSNEINVRLGRLSVEFFEHFKEQLELGPGKEDMDFHQVGFLLLGTSAQRWAELQKDVATQRRLGVAVETLTPQEAAKLCPDLNTEDIVGATFCASDGHGSQHEVLQAFVKKARQMGVRFRENCAVSGLKIADQRIVEVETTQGTLQPGIVIGCAGAWSAILGGMAGVKIPVWPVRRNLFYAEASWKLNPHLPVTVDMGTGFYFRKEGPGILMGEINPAQPPGFDTALDWDWFETVIEHAIARVPRFEQLQIVRGWAGLYDTSPDGNAIIGNVPGLENFYIATGFSGNGIMFSPAAGLLMAELVLDGAAHTLDISALNPARFRQPEKRRIGPERNIF